MNSDYEKIIVLGITVIFTQMIFGILYLPATKSHKRIFNMGETNERANSSNSWSRRKIAILIVGILFIFMLVVILGYVFVKMSDGSSDDESYNIMVTVPTVLANETTVSTDKYSILNAR